MEKFKFHGIITENRTLIKRFALIYMRGQILFKKGGKVGFSVNFFYIFFVEKFSREILEKIQYKILKA